MGRIALVGIVTYVQLSGFQFQMMNNKLKKGSRNSVFF